MYVCIYTYIYIYTDISIFVMLLVHFTVPAKDWLIFCKTPNLSTYSIFCCSKYYFLVHPRT